MKRPKSPIIPIIIIIVIAVVLFWMNQSRKKEQEEILIQKVNNAEVPEKFEGIGVMLAKRENIVTVVKVVEDSPAERVGLKVGDRVMKINQEATREMDLNEVSDLIRGEIGSHVTLTISRSGNSPEETENVVVTRGEIINEGSIE
ncbi:S41 family peptidase [Patescibacteria group bacterium]